MVYFIIGVGGIIGAVLRYYLGIWSHGWWNFSFPLGTLLINYFGAFVLGWFLSIVAVSPRINHYFRLGFGTGFVGSFTTFSTFSVETITLLQQHFWTSAVLYVIFSFVGGLLAVWMGSQLANLQRKKYQEGV